MVRERVVKRREFRNRLARRYGKEEVERRGEEFKRVF